MNRTRKKGKCFFKWALEDIFGYLAFRRNDKVDIHKNAKNEGKLLSDISYIKTSIERMEAKLDKVETNHQGLLTRLIKVEKDYTAEKTSGYIYNGDKK